MSDPDEIKRDIERTRAELSSDVNALSEKVSPSRVVQRRAERVGGGMARLKDRVMGTASDRAGDLGEAMQSSSSATGEALSSAGSTVSQAATSAPTAVRRQAQGNPLAAGMIAFGLGWLISSLLPASQAEKRAAGQVKDKASEVAEPIARQAREAVQEVVQDLKEPAQQAADHVKATASDAASTVTAEARSAATDVTEQAKSPERDR